MKEETYVIIKNGIVIITANNYKDALACAKWKAVFSNDIVRIMKLIKTVKGKQL